MTTTLDPIEERLGVAALDKRFRKPLLRFFFRRTSDWTDAEDLTQQTFLRLHQLRGRETARGPRTFVFAVAGFLLKEHWARQRSEGATGAGRAESLDLVGDSPELSDERSPERLLLDRDDLRHALELLKELGPRTHDIYVMFRVRQMPQSEIAELYGISVSAVRKHVLKAAGHLAARFDRP